MHKWMISAAVLCSWMLAPVQSRADVIYLKNGNEIEGVITRETDEFVYIEMPLGNISLSKSAIESIQRTPPEEAEKIRQKWDQDRKRKEREEAARARFEDRQRAKGLVKYRDAWVSPEKLSEIKQTEKGATTKEEMEKELAAVKKEMDLLRGENADLKNEIGRLRNQLEQQTQEQVRLGEEILRQQRENLEFQKEAEKRSIGQRPPHIWVAPKIDGFTPYPTPSK